MTKDELIKRLKELKENKAKRKLRTKEKQKLEFKLCQLEKSSLIKDTDIILSGSSFEGTHVSSGQISDNTAKTVIRADEKRNRQIEQIKNEIKELDEQIKNLDNKIEEAEIRLNALYYKEQKLLTAYYVEQRTAEDIATNLYFELFGRTTTDRYIRKIIENATQKIINL